MLKSQEVFFVGPFPMPTQAVVGAALGAQGSPIGEGGGELQPAGCNQRGSGCTRLHPLHPIPSGKPSVTKFGDSG